MCGQVAGVAGHHAHAVHVFEVVHRFDVFAFGHQHHLGDFKVGRGKIHALAALIGDGNGRGQHVEVAVVKAGKQAVPRLVFEAYLEAAGFGHGIEDVYIKAFNFAARALRFKRGKFGIQAHGVGFACGRAAGGSRSVFARVGSGIALTAAGGQHQTRTGHGSGQPFFHVHCVVLLKKPFANMFSGLFRKDVRIKIRF